MRAAARRLLTGGPSLFVIVLDFYLMSMIFADFVIILSRCIPLIALEVYIIRLIAVMSGIFRIRKSTTILLD